MLVVVDVSGVWWVKTKFHWGYLFIAAVHAHGACTAKATTDTHTHTHAQCVRWSERERHTQTHPEAMAEAWLELRLTHLLLRKFVIKRFLKANKKQARTLGMVTGSGQTHGTTLRSALLHIFA